MSKKVIVTIVTLLIIIAIAINARSLLLKRKAEIQNAPLPHNAKEHITFVMPQTKQLMQNINLQATLLAQKEVKISTKVAGYIKKLYVSEAQKVAKGENLVDIDDTEILSNIAMLEAQLKANQADFFVAKDIYESNKKLYAIGGIAKEKLDGSKVAYLAKKAQLEATKQKLSQAKELLNYLHIKAPFDGVVQNVLLHEGDLALSAKPVLTLMTKEQKILFSYPSTLNVTVGQEVFYEKKAIGAVTKIYPSAKNYLSMAEVHLTQSLNLPTNSLLNINLVVAKKEGCVVPNGALIYTKEANYIITKEGSSYKKQKVLLQMQTEDESMITPCPTNPVAVASQQQLISLEAMSHEK